MRNIFHKPVETNFKKSISMVILSVDYYKSLNLFKFLCKSFKMNQNKICQGRRIQNRFLSQISTFFSIRFFCLPFGHIQLWPVFKSLCFDKFQTWEPVSFDIYDQQVRAILGHYRCSAINFTLSIMFPSLYGRKQ